MARMRYIKKIIFLLMLIAIPVSYAANRVVYYEPVITTLRGVINIKVLPGSPNYESIKNGDRAETGYYIVLKKPIDVELPAKRYYINSNDEPVKSIQVLQLAIMNDKLWSNIKRGNNVAITGTLFYWQSGHHHTKVLMAVNKAHVIKRGYPESRLLLTDYVVKIIPRRVRQ